MRRRENKAKWLHIEGGIILEKGVKLGAERKEEISSLKAVRKVIMICL